MAQFPAVIELSSLDGTNGFEIFGKNSGDGSGSPVASAGDVNGDGFDDVIIGAGGTHGHGGSGESYVVFGKASGFAADLSAFALDGTNGFQITGDAARDRAGSSVASAGDINGDGFADVIVGAYRADSNGYDSGASYVVFGKASGFPAEFKLRGIDGTNGFKLSGEAAGDFSGSVASAGDVNGDGFDDLIVGAFRADPHGESSGASYVVFGKAGGFATNLDLSSLDGTTGFQISGVAAYDYSGVSVASAGDVNGDGFADLIIGAPDSPFRGNGAESFVVFGKASGFAANFELSSLDGTNGFKLSGERADDRSGGSVASAGDINGDGFADIIVGAYGHGSEASHVVFGKAGGFAADLDLGNLDGTNGFRISGGGASVASAGDVNGDGFDDIIVAKPSAGPNGSVSGASYVIFGKAGGFAANFDLSSLDGSNGFQINGEAAGDRSGGPVASAGDVNADGFADLIIGATGAGGIEQGASYVVFGAKPGEAVVRNGTDIAQTIRGGDFDDRLSGRGGDDTLVGYAGNDAIKGGTGNDAACGGDGNDSLRGDAGNDTLKGNSGDDILTGGKGFDRLTGGADSDTFVFKSAAEIGLSAGARDVIVDFVHRTDHIDLAAIDADTGAAGDQAFSFIGTADFSGTAGELRYARTDAGITLIAGDINGDGVTDFRLELSGLLALNADDFVL